MADETVLRIVVDPSGTVQGAEVVKKQLGGVSQAAKRTVEDVKQTVIRIGDQTLVATRAGVAAAQQQARGQANAIVTVMENTLRSQTSRIQEAMRRGLLSKEDAERAGREAGRSFASSMQKAYKQGFVDLDSGGVLRAGNQTFMEFNGQLRSMSDYSKSAGFNVGALRESVASFATQAAGAHPIVGRLASEVGMFARGAPMTVAVLGGLGLIGLAWRALGKEAADAKKEHKAAMDELDNLREKQRGERGAMHDNVLEAEFGLDRSQRGSRFSRALSTVSPLLDVIGLDVSRLARNRANHYEQEIQRYTERVKTGSEEITKSIRDEIAEATEAYNRAAKERIAAANEERAAFLAMIEAGYGTAKQLAQLRGEEERLMLVVRDVTRSWADRHDALGDVLSIQNAVNAAAERASELQDKELRRLRELNKATGEAAIAARYSGQWGDVRRNLDMRLDLNDGAVTPYRPPNEDAEYAAATAKAQIDHVAKAWEEAARGIQRTMAAGFDSIFTDGVSGFEDFAGDVLGIFRGLAAQIASAMAIEALGIEDILTQLQRPGGIANLSRTQRGAAAGVAGLGIGYGFGSGVGGAGGVMAGTAAGAASGAMIAGPAGAAAGALTGFIGALVGSAEAARAAAAAQRSLRESLSTSIESFRMEVSGSELDRALAGIRSQVGQLNAQARGVADLKTRHDIMLEIERLAKQREQQVQGEFAFEASSRATGLGVRSLRARGFGAAADEMELIQQQAAELFEAIKRGAEVAELSAIAAVQAEERLARERQQEAERIGVQADFMGDIAARRAMLGGDSEGAAAIRLQSQQRQEVTAAQGLYDAGLITIEMLEALADVLNLELAQAAENARQQIEGQRIGFDFDIMARRAAVNGDDLRAAEIRRIAGAGSELAAARELYEAGVITEQQLLELSDVLNLELAKAAKDAAQAVQDAADAMAAAKRSLEQDIEIDWLRAMGRDIEADTLGINRDYDDAVKRAQEQGLEDRFLKMLDEIRNSRISALAGVSELQTALSQANSWDEKDITRSSVQQITSVDAKRVVDINISMLTVQQQMDMRLAQIAENTRGGGGVTRTSTRAGGVTIVVYGNVYGPGAEHELARRLKPLLNTSSGEEVEYDARLQGQT